MGQIIEALKGLRGKNVNIYTDHKLFGKQHIQMKFEPETEIGLGFRCKEQVIYINNNDIINYCIEGNKIIINGKLMRISIIETI